MFGKFDALQKYGNLGEPDLENVLKMDSYLQKSALIRTRTSPPKFAARTIQLALTLAGFLTHSPGQRRVPVKPHLGSSAKPAGWKNLSSPRELCS